MVTNGGLNITAPESVSLNVVEELWQLLADSDHSSEDHSPSAGSHSGDDLMAVSLNAVAGTTSRKTIKLLAYIHQYKVHSFLSEQMASLLPSRSQLQQPINVKVADGGIIMCTHEVVDCAWLIEGHQFSTTFKIIPRDGLVGTA